MPFMNILSSIRAFSSIQTVLKGSQENHSLPILDNLTMHFTPAVGITKDESNLVSAWSSNVGNISLSQNEGSLQPLWINNVLNGYPVVQCDGTNDGMAAGGLTPPSSESTIILVVKNQDSSGRIVSYGTTSDAWWLYFNVVGESNFSSYLGAGIFSKTLTQGSWSIVAARARDDYMQFQINTGTIFELSNVNIKPVVGNYFSIGDGGFGGQYAEIAVYESFLSNADVATIQQHLSDKFGLGLSF